MKYAHYVCQLTLTVAQCAHAVTPDLYIRNTYKCSHDLVLYDMHT